MANTSKRFHLNKGVLDEIVRSLDDARFCLISQMERNTGTIPSSVCAAINKLLSATQWVVHQEPFLTAHQEQWKERSNGEQ